MSRRLTCDVLSWPTFFMPRRIRQHKVSRAGHPPTGTREDYGGYMNSQFEDHAVTGRPQARRPSPPPAEQPTHPARASASHGWLRAPPSRRRLGPAPAARVTRWSYGPWL